MCILPNWCVARAGCRAVERRSGNAKAPSYDFPPSVRYPLPGKAGPEALLQCPTKSQSVGWLLSSNRRGRKEVQLGCHSILSTFIDIAGVIAMLHSAQTRVGGFQPPSWWNFID